MCVCVRHEAVFPAGGDPGVAVCCAWCRQEETSDWHQEARGELPHQVPQGRRAQHALHCESIQLLCFDNITTGEWILVSSKVVMFNAVNHFHQICVRQAGLENSTRHSPNATHHHK